MSKISSQHLDKQPRKVVVLDRFFPFDEVVWTSCFKACKTLGLEIVPLLAPFQGDGYISVNHSHRQ